MGSDMFFLLFVWSSYEISIIHKLLPWNEYQFYVFPDDSDFHSVRLRKKDYAVQMNPLLFFVKTVIVMRCMGGLGSILLFL